MAPRGPQALEHRAVRQPELGRVPVESLQRHGLGACGRPLGQRELGRPRAGCDRAGGVPGPRLLVDPGVDVERAPVRGVGRAEGDLQLHGPAFGQHQRRFEGQVLDPAAADLVARPDRQLDETRAGKDNHVTDGVVGEPRVAVQAEAGGEHEAVGVGEHHGGAEQRVVGGDQPGGGHVAHTSGDLKPVVLALEGVRRQVDASATRVDGRPVHADASHVQFGQRQVQAVQPALVAAQRARDDRVLAHGVQRLLQAHRQHRVGGTLHETAEPLGGQRAHRGVELHRAAQVVVPVLGIHGRGVDPATGHGGVERHLTGPRRDGTEIGQQPVVDQLHLRRVGGVVHRDLLDPDLVRAEGGHHLVQRLGRARDDDRVRAVDRGQRQPSVPGRQARGHVLGGQRHRHHAALARQHVPDRRAAQRHNPSSVLNG